MREDDIYFLIKKYSEGQSYSKEVQHSFQRWIINSKDIRAKECALKSLWETTPSDIDLSTLEALEKTKNIIERRKLKKQLFVFSFRVAAIFIFIITSSIAWYYLGSKSFRQVNMVECFVEAGSYRQITLPDRSVAWVNSNSVLIYPEKFEGKTRTIYLNGEANFSVERNEQKPFIVKTQFMDIEALGTVFNVKAYPELTNIIATLEEGKIRVSLKNEDEKSFVILPNEQIRYNYKTSHADKFSVDAKKVSSWKEGYLFFQQVQLQEIFSALSKKFNVLILFDPEKFEGRNFTVYFAPDDSLSQIMDVLKDVGHFNYKIQGETIYID